ncbi:serine hydrolase domain-containing protein [Aestuariirhabdus litorea]|uniref:Class C beta-lactamase-related serine hydrolase n=1 Tax=Aestuariirhabdus litorea TaxID=2528527 RepID=A0A3P3VUD0_9GAMM|nr:serine hydrolase [Aestuariirhabdus litorea]RRJ85226.1 class C beta-lactamase-related serine hydrolase [Aestuariirhabdus litorea]RWW98447.1 class C beta-lactamase-related serine hydrolase [Endozoicomonadaceae bacterium GTF-13]
MKPTLIAVSALLAALGAAPLPAAEQPTGKAPMQGFPPSVESQVTRKNYRDYPNGRWSFRNAGAPFNVLMIPREGEILPLNTPLNSELGNHRVEDLEGNPTPLDALFERNDADGLIVLQGGKVLHERYFHAFNPHAQHIWFSMTKSLVSSAFGLLVAEGKVDLGRSPAHYIPELKGSGFERVSIQQLLDHSTAIDFKENYTDPNADFLRHYAPALNMAWLPGAADVQPGQTEIYGIYDFLTHFVKEDPALKPGEAFDYNSSNADVLGWLVARLSGQSLHEFLQQRVWAKLGAEHDAYIAVDRAYMPVATGGMNTTLRDAARFGQMILDRGRYNGQSVIPATWVDATLEIDPRLERNMRANAKYQRDPWQAYHNMWWVLDAKAGEYCAVGIFGQVIYLNREAGTTMAWYSSQPTASSANNPQFQAKLKAARELARSLTP